ncbi:MAG TPA: UDP-N-acetylmuramoyl-tripeptide--D-alanyl-D-alanine ligase [Gammaproteobacteria bacterium]|nr:UDP-N-acetylmuramoyl-tripeptide--D-alanyl-D-alanine ligase [Gammaproteobacteria bacterium]
MMERTLATVARATGGRLHGNDATFTRVCTDTRRLAAGELFVALRGPRFDGHVFAPRARELGAAGLVVEHHVSVGLPEVLVDDTRLALGRWAAAWRAQFALPVVGVTGSNGKTTTRALIASILAERGPTHATSGNLNNDIGVPLTLLELAPEHVASVVEMGANHAGEIAYLTRLARPTVGLVTNVGPAHLEGFGSLEGVARAKGELYLELPAEATAVVNVDERWSSLWREFIGQRRTLYFGTTADADFTLVPGSLREERAGSRFTLRTPDGEAEIVLPLAGRHNVHNALGAAAAAWAAGATLAHIAAGLARARGVGGRLKAVAGPNGATVVDDTYNANPASMRAALDWAASLGSPVWFAMGDMGELGAEAPRLHAEIGAYARAHGVGRLLALGPLARHAVEAFGAGAEHFDDVEALITELKRSLPAGVTLLVKGSRSMRMERIVQALVPAIKEEA